MKANVLDGVSTLDGGFSDLLLLSLFLVTACIAKTGC